MKLKEKKDVILREVFEYIKVIIIAVIVVLILDNTLIANAKVVSGSMENTVMTGSRVFVYRQAYLFSDPKRGDIVTFHFPDSPDKDFFKRIIGLPGETVEGRSGYVYINGKKLDEPYVKDKIKDDFGPYQVPAGSYFMMGDNRNNSWDSRDWKHKYVKKDAIIGKAEFEYFPKIKNLR